MSKVPFMNFNSSDGQHFEYEYGGGESSCAPGQQQSGGVETKKGDLHSSDDLSETGDLGVGELSYASYQKSGRKNKENMSEEADGFDEDDFVNINSSLNSGKTKSYIWLRHPQVRENWKTVTGAIFLLVIGLAFLICAIVLSAIPEHNGPKAVIFYVCAAVCILPGGYHTVYIYRATKGWRGYNFESLPNFH